MAIIETEKEVIRITATKTVEYVEEYEISVDEFKHELINYHDFDEEEVNNFSDEELLEVANQMCTEEELEDFIVKSPNTDFDRDIEVEDIYKTTLTAITNTETNTTTYEDRGL